MIPILTTTQVKDGISGADLMIDLSEYMKKKDAATKVDLQALTAVVANKLDVEPQHKHHISDIKQLQEELNTKLDTSNKYSFSTLISDIETIPYLTAPEVGLLNITGGYKIYSDSASGDLMVLSDDILVASYTKATHTWSFAGVQLTDPQETYEELTAKINSLEAEFREYKTQTEAVLKNHYDAIYLLCSKHGMTE